VAGRTVKLGKYLKAAFLSHWNLLAFVGGLGFAAVSGRPDVVAPLVLAGEVAYLGLLGTHPKFQKYVNAQEAKGARAQSATDSAQAAERLLAALPPTQARRFEGLRARCRDLQQIALEIHDPARPGTAAPLEALQLAGLDRLLWIYLRLLYTQNALDRFLQQASEAEMAQGIRDLEGRVAALAGDAPQRQRMRKSLEDNLATSQARLDNYRKARDNSELVAVEIDRLENKIHSLSEMAVNRQEPGFISGQVDEVAQSLVQTERTMSELQLLTGMAAAEQEAPDLLRRSPVQIQQ
jgi:chemotaxis protein histidine kinase CheA